MGVRLLSIGCASTVNVSFCGFLSIKRAEKAGQFSSVIATALTEYGYSDLVFVRGDGAGRVETLNAVGFGEETRSGPREFRAITDCDPVRCAAPVSTGAAYAASFRLKPVLRTVVGDTR